MVASGADVPPELLPRILRYIIADVDTDPELRDGFMSASSQEDCAQGRILGPCNLTCCFWAEYCRPFLFRSIVLRSARSVRRLQKLLDSPVLPRLTSIRLLATRWRIEHLNGNTPWLHEAFALIMKHQQIVRPYNTGVPLLPLSLELNFDAVSKTAVAYNRSVVHYLPRTMPLHLLSIRYLCLTNIEFGHPTDLLRLLHGLPHLYRIFMIDLTWRDASEDRALIRLPHDTRNVDICSRDGTRTYLDMILLWTLNAAMTLRRGDLRYATGVLCRIVEDTRPCHPIEPSLLYQLACHLLSGLENIPGITAKPFTWYMGYRWMERVPGDLTLYALRRPGTVESYAPHLYATLDTPKEPHAGALIRVHTITLDFIHVMEPICESSHVNIDWKSIMHQLVKEFLYLHSIMMYFRTKREWSTMINLHQHILHEGDILDDVPSERVRSLEMRYEFSDVDGLDATESNVYLMRPLQRS